MNTEYFSLFCGICPIIVVTYAWFIQVIWLAKLYDWKFFRILISNRRTWNSSEMCCSISMILISFIIFESVLPTLWYLLWCVYSSSQLFIFSALFLFFLFFDFPFHPFVWFCLISLFLRLIVLRFISSSDLLIVKMMMVLKYSCYLQPS